MGLYGGMEIGGTKCVCAIGTGSNAVCAETRFATTTAQETMARAIAFFAPYRDELAALGVGAFGPLDLRPDASTFGCITTTPKPGWAYTNVVETLQRALACPVVLDTDVNVAAFGEYCWGNAQGLETFVYLTVGTGIGGGAMVHGRLLHGLLHPEMGHMRIPHDWQTDPFVGTCPYHGDCLEGLAAGPALLARWGHAGEALPANHGAWKLEARYLALALVSIICTLAPQRLILGGGVMQQRQLFPLLRQEVQHVLNGYLSLPDLDTRIDDYIVPPVLGDRAGVLGALALTCRTSTKMP